MLAAGVVVSTAIVWVLGEVERWRGARFWTFATVMVGGWTWFLIGTLRDRRDLDEIERELRDAGVQIPDEPPVPIKLAESRESLLVSIIALVLIAGVLVAYYAGWLERLGLIPTR
jgi:hypothetical protein